MAFVEDCNTSVRALLVVCLICLGSLPSAASELPSTPGEGAEANVSTSLACEALMQGLLIGVLGVAVMAVRDHGGAAVNALVAVGRGRRTPREEVEVPLTGAAAEESFDDGGRRSGTPPWARVDDGKAPPAAACEPDDFGARLAAARRGTPEGAAEAAVKVAVLLPPRPALPKPGRARRARQLHAKVAEFCSLRFDDVDTTEQMGLTCRMLATLKSLAQDVSYWDDVGKHDEPTFLLLGLDEVAMFAASRAAKKAEPLVEERCWREAYTELCTACPWLSSETHGSPSEEQRAKVLAEMNDTEVHTGTSLERLHGEDISRTESFDSSADCKSPGVAGNSPSSISVILRLPAGGTCRVIGPRAATVNALQSETGARIWLDRNKSEAHISGPEDAVEAAQRGIQFLLTPLRDTEADVPPASPSSRTPVKEIMCRFFQNGTCSRGKECHFLHATPPHSDDDEETRASTDEEPLGVSTTRNTKRSGDNLPIRSRAGTGNGGKSVKGSNGTGLSGLWQEGLWQEKPDVTYRVQAHGELSWTAVVCGSRASEKTLLSYDEVAGVYWWGASRNYFAVRVGMDRLDWYLGWDQKRTSPELSWLRQQRQSPKQAPRRPPAA